MGDTTVLIVEDEEIVAADLANKLGQLGYKVVGTAAEGEEAIEMACSLKPQVVLMDIRLHGPMDGIEAAEAVRRRYDVPVIYLTAHSDPATLERAKISEPFGYILKPFEERELATAIEMALYKHKSERHMREQRAWLRVTLTSIGDAVITCDTDGRVTFLNPVAEALTGWKSDDARELPIQRVFLLVNEDTHQPIEDPVALVLQEGRPSKLSNHTALVTRDGREVPVEDSAAPILDAEGRVIGAVLVFHDVTEKRRAQETLQRLLATVQKEKERLSCLLNSINDEILFADTNRKITLANPSAVREFSLNLSDGIDAAAMAAGLEVYRSDGSLRPVEEAPLLRSLAGEEIRGEEEIIRTPGTGELRHRQVSFAPVRDANGQIIGSISVARDETERKRFEDRLAADVTALSRMHDLSTKVLEADRLEPLLQEIMDASVTIMKAEKGTLQLMEDNSLRIVAHHGHDRPFLDFFAKAESVASVCGEATKRVDRIVVDDVESSSIFAGTQSLAVLREAGVRAVQSTPLLSHQGEMLGILTTQWGVPHVPDEHDLWRIDMLVRLAADLIEHKKAEEVLKKLNEKLENLVAQRTAELREKDQILLLQSRQAAMGEMIGNIAHQWRQPLNALGLSVQQLMLYYDLGKFTREFLDNNVAQSVELIKHMSKTIDDFRNYFRPDKEKAEFKMNESVANTVSLIEDSFKNRHIDIEVVVKDDPVIYGYPNEFAQALLNILNNARDAMAERDINDPRVTITICSESGHAVVIIADNAGGIPEEIIGKIFEPYFTTKGPQHGTGVGLFMSKAIIEKNMGGRLAARNIANGAEFRIEV